GLGAGQLYGWRMDGPYLPMQGHRFNRHKLLADPFAKAFVGDFDMFDDALYGYDRTSSMRDRSFSQLDSARATAKSAAIAPAPVIWDTEARPRYPLEESIIYECHVKGMTAHPSSQVTHPGTYRGLCEKIPHLKALGVTTIELLPVAQYNALEPPTLVDPVTKEVHRNYWGYATIGFFSPHASYASVETPCGVVEEFRQMVRAFHEAQIEVILDVVFNHSGEGNERGATIAFRGLDNAVYYMLDAKGRYANYTGCGNTMNCNHPVMKHLIIECLRYWVVEMHIDGFRFDLATILGRSNKGEWISDPNLSLLNDIASDPVLRGCKLIAEAWDAAGLYKVGRFPLGWAEWNGMFRDDVRRFWRGDNGTVFGLAQRIAGSKDLFGDKQTASHSVNFITAHDGFTLRDCCSYLQKHNKRNGEQNRDGCNDNFSDNFGVEGETRDGAIRSRRLRRAKNMMATLFLSRGMPMILGGDEIWRTQRGNNNGFCQDNDISWHDWRPSSESEEMFAFCQKCIALRKAYKALRQTSFGDPQHRGHTNDLRFHGVHLLKPDWLDISHSLAFELTDGARGARFYVAMNAWCEALTFEIPRRRWYKIVDTAQPSPQDFIMPDACPPQVSGRVVVEPDSLCVLISFEHS
ncbi:MAG: glycogen debranching protein GlgX, partial [Proteobacteria bacterium]|nr:glycogen debranching protein GlgX [Pseudomonadota bacterium]